MRYNHQTLPEKKS